MAFRFAAKVFLDEAGQFPEIAEINFFHPLAFAADEMMMMAGAVNGTQGVTKPAVAPFHAVEDTAPAQFLEDTVDGRQAEARETRFETLPYLARAETFARA